MKSSSISSSRVTTRPSARERVRLIPTDLPFGLKEKVSSKEVTELFQNMKRKFFEQSVRREAQMTRLKSSDPFQSDYFNQNLFEINLKKIPEVKRELKTANLTVHVSSSISKAKATNDVGRDFQRVLDSVHCHLQRSEAVGLTTRDTQVLSEAIGAPSPRNRQTSTWTSLGAPSANS